MSDLYKLDVVYRKMLRTIVGPPNFVEWNAPWHDILHHWVGKALALAQQHGLNTWSEQCLKHPGKFAMHVAGEPEGPSSTRRCLSQISTCGGGATFEH